MRVVLPLLLATASVLLHFQSLDAADPAAEVPASSSGHVSKIILNADGSRTLFVTDKLGRIVARAMAGRESSEVRVNDSATGRMTVSTRSPEGLYSVRVFSKEGKILGATSGGKPETPLQASVTENDSGKSFISSFNPDGSLHVTVKDADGAVTHTTDESAQKDLEVQAEENADGSRTQRVKDLAGNTLAKCVAGTALQPVTLSSRAPETGQSMLLARKPAGGMISYFRNASGDNLSQGANADSESMLSASCVSKMAGETVTCTLGVDMSMTAEVMDVTGNVIYRARSGRPDEPLNVAGYDFGTGQVITRVTNADGSSSVTTAGLEGNLLKQESFDPAGTLTGSETFETPSAAESAAQTEAPPPPPATSEG